MNHSMYTPIFFLLFGIAASYFGASTKLKNNTLQQSGIVVQSLDIEGNTDIISNGSHTIHEIFPKFKTQSGETVSCRAKVNNDIQAHLLHSHIVEIRYLVDNPEVCEVIGSDTNSNTAPLVMGIVAILASMIFIGKKKQSKA